jgi:shikimate kinase
MNQMQNLFLVGPMGAGKSTIGKQLAKQLKLAFFDSDHEIESRTGVDIPLIFELEGEAGFRKREAAMIDELTSQDGIVLATGGGAILDKNNRRNLADRGKVIYLHTSIDQQLTRTRRDRNRPLLQTDDPRARLEELMLVREPIYRGLADLVIDTNHKRTRDVVRDVVRLLKQES